MANMAVMMKACTQPHALAHMVTGLGVGLLVVGLVPTLAASGVVLGIIVIVLGVLFDMMVNKG